jgi:hypothetical protein
METSKQRGGARKGAGRKPVANPLKTRAIRLSDDDWVKLKAIGMSRLREFINKTMA